MPTMQELVQVGDLTHRTKCWVQCLDPNNRRIFSRCGLKKGHEGPHAWDPSLDPKTPTRPPNPATVRGL